LTNPSEHRGTRPAASARHDERWRRAVGRAARHAVGSDRTQMHVAVERSACAMLEGERAVSHRGST
jgi:hypothetical protein